MEPLARRPKRTEFHLYPELPEDAQSYIFAFQAPGHAAATSKNVREAVDSAKVVWSYEKMMASPEGSLIAQLVRRQVWVDSPEGRANLVDRVTRAAAEILMSFRRNLIPPDFTFRGLDIARPHFLKLSFEEMNDLWNRIQTNPQDSSLVVAFRAMLPEVPESIVVPENRDVLRNRAAAIRAWINDPANQERIESVQNLGVLDAEDLSQIPSELLRFPNLELAPLLSRAVETIQPQIVQAILNDPREIHELDINESFRLSWAHFFLPEIIEAFIQSRYPLPSDHLGALMMRTSQVGNWRFVHLILNSERPYDLNPVALGELLKRAVKAQEWEIAESILQSDHPIDSVKLGEALKISFAKGNGEFAREILNVDREIDPMTLGSCLGRLCHAQKWAAVQFILGTNHLLSPHTVGEVLRMAIIHKQFEIAQNILNSPRFIAEESIGEALRIAVTAKNEELANLLLERDISPEWMGLALRDAAEKEDVEMVRLLLSSGKEIEENDLDYVRSIAAPEIQQELTQRFSK